MLKNMSYIFSCHLTVLSMFTLLHCSCPTPLVRYAYSRTTLSAQLYWHSSHPASVSHRLPVKPRPQSTTSSCLKSCVCWPHDPQTSRTPQLSLRSKLRSTVWQPALWSSHPPAGQFLSCGVPLIRCVQPDCPAYQRVGSGIHCQT